MNERYSFTIVLPVLDPDKLPPGWDDKKIELFKENTRLIGFFLGRFLENGYQFCHQDLEEINSEMNEKYFYLIGSYDSSKGELSTYLVRSLKGVFLDKMRAIYGRRSAKYKKPEILPLEKHHLSFGKNTPEEEVLKKQTYLDILERCLCTLKKKDRKIVFDHFILGKKQSEIATELGVTVSAISHSIGQSLLKMRNTLTSEEIKNGFAD